MDQKLSMHHLRRRAVDPHRGSSSIIASSSSVAVVKPEEVTLSSNSSTSQSSSTSQLSSTSTDSALPTSFVSANLTSTTELTSSSMSKTGPTTEHSATRTEQSLSGHSSFLGSFDAQPQMASITPPNAGGVPASPGHSVIDLTAQAPMDPHSYNQFQLYPDFRPYDSRGLSPIQERDPDPPFSITNPPFKRPAAGRGSYQSYQASIDSFYCGPRS
ncbi:hypothetical protein H0H93_000054 [Arthromyces matolae]|nr:hypothetical protein H0H93_000054 [Arthromyces matolae]